MDYTLDSCDKYMDQELDKMGSDYFPLIVKLNQFQKATFDFLRETTELLETTQEISDDILPLVVYNKEVVLVQQTQTNLNNPNVTIPLPIYLLDLPEDYFRLIYTSPLYNLNGILTSKVKRVKIIKHGQEESLSRDPFNSPTPDYPHVLRHENTVQINVGDFQNLDYSNAILSYVRKPVFANENQLDQRIVDLPDLSIEKIIDRTTNSLRTITSDSGAVQNYQFDQTFGKRNQ